MKSIFDKKILIDFTIEDKTKFNGHLESKVNFFMNKNKVLNKYCVYLVSKRWNLYRNSLFVFRE